MSGQSSTEKSAHSSNDLSNKKGPTGSGPKGPPSYAEGLTAAIPKIGYYDPFSLYPKLQDDIAAKLPLTNIHWKSPSRPLRSIPSLAVDLTEELPSNSRAKGPMHQMPGIASVPYVQLMFFTCQDVDSYRNEVRPLIREWLKRTVNNERDPTEWFIVYYHEERYKFRNSLIEKFRVDFNNANSSSSSSSNSKQNVDRIVILHSNYSSPMEKIEAWSDFATRLKDGILRAFGNRVALYEHEVAKVESQKHIPGWNFGKFYSLKESLAIAFEHMCLYEDALIIYQELESLFDRLFSDNAVSFFTAVGFNELPSSIREYSTVLSSKLREEILSNKISLFDFRCYLFSQQAKLLLNISRVSSSPSVASKRLAGLLFSTRKFIANLENLLLSSGKQPEMIAEWAFNTANEFLYTEKDISDFVAETPELAEARGHLVLVARSSLVRLARAKGWLIKGLITNIEIQDYQFGEETEYEIHSAQLKEVLQSELQFQACFEELTKKAIKEFEMAVSPRLLNNLFVDVALLKYYQQKYEDAAEILQNHHAVYDAQGWTFIEAYLLRIYYDCLKNTGQRSHLLKACLDFLSMPSFLSDIDVSDAISTIMEVSLQHSCEYPLDHLFELEIFPYVSPCNSSHGSSIYEITIGLHSNFCEVIQFTELTLTMRSTIREHGFVEFSLPTGSESHKLPPGTTRFVLSSTEVKMGEFILEHLNLSINGVSLYKSFTTSLSDVDNILIFPGPDTFSAKFTQPQEIELNQTSVCLEITTGPEDIQNLNINITPEPSSIVLDPKGAIAKTNGGNSDDTKLTLAEGVSSESSNSETSEMCSMIVKEAPKNSTLQIILPYQMLSDRKEDKVEVNLTCSLRFQTTSSTGELDSENTKLINHEFVFEDAVSLSLLISVSVQDAFRADYIFSRFLVGPSAPETPVRILATELQGNQSYLVESPTKPRDVISFANQPVASVFRITPVEGYKMTATDALVLKVSYRLLADEIFDLVWRSFCDRLVRCNSNLNRYLLLLRPILLSFCQAVDLTKYSQTGFLMMKKFDVSDAEWLGIYCHIPPELRKQTIEVLESFVSENETFDDTSFMDQLNRTLLISVTLPPCHVLHTIEFQVLGSIFTVGKPIETVFTVESRFNWNGGEMIDSNESYELELERVQENWMIAGMCRFTWTPQETSIRVPITLIPLKSGRIKFPEVNITSRNVKSNYSMEVNYRNGVQSVLIVPELDRVILSF